MRPPFVEPIGAGIIVSLWNRCVLPWVVACVAAVVEQHEDLSSETSACSAGSGDVHVIHH